MARIRIVDEWMRTPSSPPVSERRIMVVAETWAEQKVLMRALASSPDAREPVIGLQGRWVAISPAGVDPYGPWGVHVDPPADGVAQDLRLQLQDAARQLAGTKGNPPRLVDERDEDRRPTGKWMPQPTLAEGESARVHAGDGTSMPAQPAASVAVGTPIGRRMRRETAVGHTSNRSGPLGSGEVGAKTAFGYAASSAPVQPRRSYQSASKSASLASVVGKTMPVGFRLAEAERRVLDALSGGTALSDAEVAAVAQVADGRSYMADLMAKLSGHGLDLIAVDGRGYHLRAR